VPSGTLIKMYDYKAPKSNICGELFRKLEDYLLKPVLPLRLIECRQDYSAKVMQNTIWNRLAAWSKDNLEEGFEEGASIQIKLANGETIPAEVRVFKIIDEDDPDADAPQTGLRALINGQSHAKRDTQFFKTDAVGLDTHRGQHVGDARLHRAGANVAQRYLHEQPRELPRRPLLKDIFKKLQKELRNHEGLKELTRSATRRRSRTPRRMSSDISALEDLLANDPSLADLFSSILPGKVAAATAAQNPGQKITGKPQAFTGKEFPTYFKRADGHDDRHHGAAEGR